MIPEITSLMGDYTKWLSDKTILRQIEDWVEITTPFLDRHNDYLQIYIRKHNNGYLLTDDAHTITDLKHSGCNLESKKRKDLLTLTLNGYGVKLDPSNALTIQATPQNFSLKKHNLVQAMLAVNDLFYLSVPVVASLFLEDVIAWFDANEIRYVEQFKYTGTSGYDHIFDFIIPKTKKYPERIVNAINRPSRDTVDSFAWSWVDTKEARPSSRAYAILNDIEVKYPATVPTALANYDIISIPWSQRESHLELFLN